MTTPDSPARAVHMVVKGKVRRVGFRRFAKQSADQLGLTGWVRNRRQGDVEILAVGKKELLETFLSKVRHGPKNAIVQDVSVQWQEPSQTFRRFRIQWLA